MIITSKENELLKDTAKLLSSARYRRETGRFVAEGVRLCMDGAQSGAAMPLFLSTEAAQKKYTEEYAFLCRKAQKTALVSENLFKKLSDTITPQGFLCVFETLDRQFNAAAMRPQRHYAALECLQDPSNLGTILRTAEALGIDGVILSSDCCDIWSPKVVRGSMGAVFRVPVWITGDLPSAVLHLTGQGFATFASTPHEADDLRETDFSGGGVMLIGNEGNGLKPETIRACRQRVRIDMKGRAESLNAAAAAAILLYELCAGGSCSPDNPT